ncbi:MAG TPA: tryptophan-rich sensory protein [Anaerolineales bacterium]
MNKFTIRQIVNVLAVIATLVVNGLANALPLNGQTTGEISDRFQVYFVPAGYVFSIWGLIYLALIAFAIYQAIPAQRNNPRLNRIGYLFALSSLANMTWLFLWHYEQFLLTLIAMLSLLGLLIAIYLRLEVGRSPVSAGEKWFVHIPFSIYLGWITVATIANITQVLDFINWNGWGVTGQIWALIMLIAGGVITLVVYQTRNDVAYVLVIIWSYVGIAVKQVNAPAVALPAWIIAGLLALLLLASALLMQRRKRTSELASTQS